MEAQRYEELKAQHGRIAVVPVIDGDYEVVLRKPSPGEWQRYKAQYADPDTRINANADLTRQMIVHAEQAPGGEPVEFKELLREYPALLDELTKPALKHAGMSGAATAKKV